MSIGGDPRFRLHQTPSFHSPVPTTNFICHMKRTRWQALLELLSLLGVVDDEGVEVARAADLELGLGRASLGCLLDARG